MMTTKLNYGQVQPTIIAISKFLPLFITYKVQIRHGVSHRLTKADQ